jgi:energy-coupling factor transporter ATP-binding protein EcfA2
VLSLQGVSFRYPGVGIDALHGVTLDLPPGTLTGLVGPDGAGKSTLCLVASGLAPRVLGGRLVGELRIDGRDVREWPMHRLVEHVTCGLQEPGGQLSQLAETVLEEVAFGPANLGLPRDAVIARSEEALRVVGLEAALGRAPSRLSGGEQQLLVLAGLLAMRPRCLVLDEPLAHLDAVGADRVLAALRRAADGGTAVLLAEQRTDALLDHCERVAVLAKGNVVALGRPADVLADPATLALGVAEPMRLRLRRELFGAGLDPDHVRAVLQADPPGSEP